VKVPKARRLPSGTWFIQLRLGGESIPVTASTEKECVRAAQYVKAEHIAGKREEAKGQGVTLGGAIDTYIKNKKNILSPASIRGYQILRDHRFQSYMDSKLSEIDYKAMCNEEAATCSPKTLKNAWGLVAATLRENGIQPPKFTLPQIPPNERPFLEPEDIPVFIRAVAGTAVEIPALLALCSLRRSELCALTWDNVDLAKKCIYVRGASVPNEANKFVQKKANKNRSSTRVVPIIMDELQKALERVEDKSGLVVKGHPDALRKQINRVCKSAGLPEVGVHGLRHSFASLAYHLGMPEKITMELGGWSDSQTMRNIYTHVAQSDRAKYTDAMSEFYAAKRDAKDENANDNAN